MLKIILEKWNKNKDKLQHIFETQIGFNGCDYKDVIKTVFDTIYNDGEDFASDRLDTEHISQIDNGDYQGTLLYLIPFATYQPSECEYLMTYVGYGSCSGCDTLKAIQMWGGYDKQLTPLQVANFMHLAKDILQNTIKPYNYGWRKDERFDPVEIDAPNAVAVESEAIALFAHELLAMGKTAEFGEVYPHDIKTCAKEKFGIEINIEEYVPQ